MYYLVGDYVYSSDVLCHHGVKNQKWGRRLYQNPDGSLTPLGRIHYGIGEKRQEAAANRKKKVQNKQLEKARAAKAAIAKNKETETQKTQDREAIKQRAIQTGNATEISKFASEMSTAELASVIDRINKLKNLSDLAAAERPKVVTGREKVEKFIKTMNTIERATAASINVWNKTALIVNSFNGSSYKIPIIGLGDNKQPSNSTKKNQTTKK